MDSLDIDAFEASLHSNDLLREGRHPEALALLDIWIARAQQEGRNGWVVIFGSSASVISQSTGNLDLVEHYSRQILESDPENTLALYTLADVFFQQGQTDLAQQYAAKAYALVANSTNEVSRGLLELLTTKWPEVSQW